MAVEWTHPKAEFGAGVEYKYASANLAAAKVANLQNELTMPFEKWLGELNEKSVEERMKAQEELRKKIDEEFIDINAYMMSLVEKLKE